MKTHTEKRAGERLLKVCVKKGRGKEGKMTVLCEYAKTEHEKRSVHESTQREKGKICRVSAWRKEESEFLTGKD